MRRVFTFVWLGRGSVLLAMPGDADHVAVGKLAAIPACHHQESADHEREDQPPGQHGGGRIRPADQQADQRQCQHCGIAQKVDPTLGVLARPLDGQEINRV